MTTDPIRHVMSTLDEHKDALPEGVYLDLCNNLKRIYASGDASKDTYLLNLTNDYLESLEVIEVLRHELVTLKRELLRTRVSRFEHVYRPLAEPSRSPFQPRSVLESLLDDPEINPIAGVNEALNGREDTQIRRQNQQRVEIPNRNIHFSFGTNRE